MTPSPFPHPMTTITTRDLEVAQSLGRLEATLNGLIQNVAALSEKFDAAHAPLADRIAKLEKWQYILAGAAAVSGGLLSKAFSLVGVL